MFGTGDAIWEKSLRFYFLLFGQKETKDIHKYLSHLDW